MIRSGTSSQWIAFSSHEEYDEKMVAARSYSVAAFQLFLEQGLEVD